MNEEEDERNIEFQCKLIYKSHLNCVCKKKTDWYPKCSWCLKHMSNEEYNHHQSEFKQWCINKSTNKCILSIDKLNIDTSENTNEGVSINYIQSNNYIITHGPNAYHPIPSMKELLENPTHYKQIFKKRQDTFFNNNKPIWLITNLTH